MKKLVIAALAFITLPVMASHTGGTRFYEVASQPKSEVRVLAQADSLNELQQVMIEQQIEQSLAQDINALLESEPTAAGQSGVRVEKRTVVDRCYHSFRAGACSSKKVYQLVESR